MQSFRFVVAVLSTTFLVSISGGTTAFAQDKQGDKKISRATKGIVTVIYLSRPSKMGFTKGQAERMGLKDMKGVPLVKATTLPPGYKMAPMTMGRKHETMDEMKGGKISGKNGTPP